MPGYLGQEVAFRFDQYNVTATPVSLTTVSSDGGLHAFRAIIDVETAQMRFRYDGGAPTSTAGHVINPGDRLMIEGRPNIAQFQVVKASGNPDGVINVTLECY